MQKTQVLPKLGNKTGPSFPGHGVGVAWFWISFRFCSIPTDLGLETLAPFDLVLLAHCSDWLRLANSRHPGRQSGDRHRVSAPSAKPRRKNEFILDKDYNNK